MERFDQDMLSLRLMSVRFIGFLASARPHGNNHAFDHLFTSQMMSDLGSTVMLTTTFVNAAIKLIQKRGPNPWPISHIKWRLFVDLVDPLDISFDSNPPVLPQLGYYRPANIHGIKRRTQTSDREPANTRRSSRHDRCALDRTATLYASGRLCHWR
jgi:hypothetical protein